jgi:hypothetical protein
MTLPIPMKTGLLLLLVVAPAACGGGGSDQGQARSQANAAVETASIDARLRAGPWRLVDYRPDVPLEATLQGLLTMQMQSMVIRFDGGHILADSPTLHVDRAYQVTGAAGPIFKIVSPDVGGGTLTTSCEISDDGRQIQFRGETEPWIGTGLLRRQ